MMTMMMITVIVKGPSLPGFHAFCRGSPYESTPAACPPRGSPWGRASPQSCGHCPWGRAWPRPALPHCPRPGPAAPTDRLWHSLSGCRRTGCWEGQPRGVRSGGGGTRRPLGPGCLSGVAPRTGPGRGGVRRPRRAPGGFESSLRPSPA